MGMGRIMMAIVTEGKNPRVDDRIIGVPFSGSYNNVVTPSFLEVQEEKEKESELWDSYNKLIRNNDHPAATRRLQG